MALIRCFDLDTSDDLKIEGGKAVLAEDMQAIKVMLKQKLNLVKGNWFLDLNEGLDYFGAILGKNRVDTEMEAEFKIAIAEVIGVTELSAFSIEIDQDRHLQVVFTAGTIFSQDIDETQPITVL